MFLQCFTYSRHSGNQKKMIKTLQECKVRALSGYNDNNDFVLCHYHTSTNVAVLGYYHTTANSTVDYAQVK